MTWALALSPVQMNKAIRRHRNIDPGDTMRIKGASPRVSISRADVVATANISQAPPSRSSAMKNFLVGGKRLPYPPKNSGPYEKACPPMRLCLGPVLDRLIDP